MIRHAVKVFLAAVLAAFGLVTQAMAQVSGAGTWTGAYQSGGTFVRMTINLSGEPNALAGDIRFDPFNPQKTANVPMGVVQVTGRVNTVARTFDITPGRDAYRTLGGLAPGFNGVFHAGGKLVAGVQSGQRQSYGGHFVLARAGTPEAKELENILKGLDRRTAQQGQGLLSGFGLGGNGAFSEKKLREWAGQYLREFPGTDAYRMTGDAVMTKGVHLFRDGYFRQFFGKSFDDLSPDELFQMERGMQAFPPPRGAYPEEMINGLILSMKYTVRPGVGSSASGLGLSVLAMRLMESWRADIQQQAQTASPNVESWRLLAEAEVVERTFFDTAWSAERKAFADAIGQSRTRMADALVNFETDRFLSDPMSRDPQLVNGIISALQQQAPQAARAPASRTGPQQVGMVAVFTTLPGEGNPEPAIRVAAPYASRDVINQQVARLNQQLSGAVGAQCDTDTRSISGFPAGLAGLETSARFYHEATSRYSRNNGRCDFAPALAQARSAMLISAEATLSQRIHGASSSGELNTLTSKYLGVPSDTVNPAGQRLTNLIAKRRDEFDVIAARQAAADAERRRQGICAQLSTVTTGDEPSERDMCNAINAQLQARMAQGDAYAANCDNMSNSVGALTCLFGKSMQAGGQGVGIGSFQKIACVSAAAQGKPGFFCDYAIRMSANNDVLGPIVNSSTGSMNTARFVKSANGWLYFP